MMTREQTIRGAWIAATIGVMIVILPHPTGWEWVKIAVGFLALLDVALSFVYLLLLGPPK